jgi:transcription initiation factor IIE alpha subunit
MTRVEEDEVIRYVREEQIAGCCHQVSDIADWINKNLLLDGRMISERLVLRNRYIIGKLKTKCPQEVD